VMVKDEDVCLHCGLCAERCPTAAWDMRTSELLLPYAGRAPGTPHVARDDGLVLQGSALLPSTSAVRPTPIPPR